MTSRLLLVHPHPDDEAIACGGLAAATLRDGHEVTIVTCTGGEEGQNQSGIDLGGRGMAEVRRQEMAAAVAALGGPDHHWLGYRDSGMAGEPSNDHPDAFHGAPVDEAAARLATIVRRVRPHVVVSDDEDGTYGHPDHVRANAVTSRAVELAADPTHDDGLEPWSTPKRYVHAIGRARMWQLHTALVEADLASPFARDDPPPEGPQDLPFGTDDEQITTVVDVGDVIDRKRAAMAAHASQIGPDSFFLNVPDALGVDAFAVEEFVLVAGRLVPDDDGLEHDVFAGLAS